MTNKGENIIAFINEFLYVQYSSTWWIDSSATIHVAVNRDFVRRELRKEMKDALK